jgi:hypothetical protein
MEAIIADSAHKKLLAVAWTQVRKTVLHEFALVIAKKIGTVDGDFLLLPALWAGNRRKDVPMRIG